MTRRFSVPFSVTLLGLMALIVVPLAGVLFWLGADTAATLEERGVQQRMSALSKAVESFLANSLQQIVLAGDLLADGPTFQSSAGDGADAERLHQLVSLLRRHPLMAGAYVGYSNGHFLYAGWTSGLSAEQRLDYGAPDENVIVLRHIDGAGRDRRETWSFIRPDGSRTSEFSRVSDFDPTKRPWYVEALATHKAALTAPYVFASADVIGISAAVPLPEDSGAFGFDITLDTLSALIADYKITPNSIIMVGTPSGRILVQSTGCAPAARNCLPGGGDARLALAAAIREAAGSRRIQRHAGAGAQTYELFVEPMARTLGRQ